MKVDGRRNKLGIKGNPPPLFFFIIMFGERKGVGSPNFDIGPDLFDYRVKEEWPDNDDST